MVLQVIGAGMSRTGVASLQAALQRLGYAPVHNGQEIIAQDQDELWRHVKRGAPDWDAIYRGYAVALDWPAAYTVQQLAARYPNSKVILTVRDPEEWYASAKATVYAAQALTVPARHISWLPQFSRIKRANGMAADWIWKTKGAFQGRFEKDPEHSKQVFREHIEKVKTFVPPERLLVFDVSQGWGPLCAFLGKPVPDIPFPHLNDRQAFAAEVARIRRFNLLAAWFVPILIAILAAVGIFFAVTFGDPNLPKPRADEGKIHIPARG